MKTGVSERYLDSHNLDSLDSRNLGSQNRVRVRFESGLVLVLGLWLGLVMTVQILTVQLSTGRRKLV